MNYLHKGSMLTWGRGTHPDWLCR